MGQWRSRIPKIGDNIFSTIDARIKRTEVEKRVMVTKSHSIQFRVMLRKMRDGVAQDKLWSQVVTPACGYLIEWWSILPKSCAD